MNFPRSRRFGQALWNTFYYAALSMPLSIMPFFLTQKTFIRGIATSGLKG